MILSRRFGLSLSRIFTFSASRNLTFTASAANAEKAELLEKNDDLSEKPILVSQNGPIRLIGINRPAKKNCLDTAASKMLSEALDAFEEDEGSEVAILHGIGGSFSSGFDLDEIAKADTDGDECFPHFGALCNRESLIKKPLIGSISGYAVDIGFELALMCDYRVMEETATMGFLNRRLNIPIMCGGTVRLPAIIGYGRAMDMILTGRMITADQAFQWGLASIVVACGSGLGQCIVAAHSLLKYPQRALLADRRAAHYGAFVARGIDEALQFEKDNASHILLEDGAAGAKKFVDGFGRHGNSKNIKVQDHSSFKELSKDML